MTFSQTVKQEIASEKDFSTERKKAVLSAFLRVNGVLVFKNHRTNLKLKTDNSKVARYIYTSLKKIYGEEIAHLSFSKRNNKKTTYVIDILDETEELLQELEVDYLEGKIPKAIAYNDETIAGYVAGCFLAGGSINSPKTSNYHLEIAANGESFIKWLAKLFLKYKKLEFEPKIIKRREKWLVYFKKSDQISNFLIMVGAPVTCMEFEDERVKRDFINSQNRLDNFELANMTKASQVGKKQAKEIKYIDDVLGIHNLHHPRKEILCYIRMENPELSMTELADLLSEEMGQSITKSSINHMLRSLHELYINLLEVKGHR